MAAAPWQLRNERAVNSAIAKLGGVFPFALCFTSAFVSGFAFGDIGGVVALAGVASSDGATTSSSCP